MMLGLWRRKYSFCTQFDLVIHCVFVNFTIIIILPNSVSWKHEQSVAPTPNNFVKFKQALNEHCINFRFEIQFIHHVGNDFIYKNNSVETKSGKKKNPDITVMLLGGS